MKVSILVPVYNSSPMLKELSSKNSTNNEKFKFKKQL